MRPFKALLTVTAAAAVIATGITVWSGSASAEAETIRIGDINSYTRLPAHTVPYRQGAILAIEEVNRSGGVLGRELELISHDDQGKPGEAVKVAERLFARDKVALISGSLFSHVGLALTAYAKQSKQLYIAAEPLADALVWAQGNRYTFRLRPSTYMQAAMLAAEVAKVEDAKRWATIAPNYAYGKDAVSAFQRVLTQLRPDVEFVGSQWPALFKIDAGAEVEALKRLEPDAIYNVTFGGDLAKFAREGKLRDLFEGRLMVGLLTGEPEYIDPLKDEAPEGWLVTGYPVVRHRDSGAQGVRGRLSAALGGLSADWLGRRLQHDAGHQGNVRTGWLDRHGEDGRCHGRAELRVADRTHHVSGDRSSIDNGGLCRLDQVARRKGRHGRLEVPRRRRLLAVG